MNIKKNLLITAFLMFHILAIGQVKTTKISFSLSVKNELKTSFKSNGRLLLYVSEKNDFEPRYSSVYNGKPLIFGTNIKNWDQNKTIYLDGNDDWIKTTEWDFNTIPLKEYYIQVVWVQNKEKESQNNAPGNLYSEPIKINTSKKQKAEIVLSKIIPNRKLEKHNLVKFFEIKSEILSKWWNKRMGLKASILLPSGYENNPNKKHPVRYHIGGYGERYTRINDLVKNEKFMSWWTSNEAPQIITVFLDGEGPFGDSYQIDSENSGPYGQALIQELIPKIEQQFRINGRPETRFVDGCSSGGWVSLALQLFYPENFNGCWSYSPDPVSFKKMQLVNIYEDENVFYNRQDYLRPSMRSLYGDPIFSVKQEVLVENVEGITNSYTTSGGQWGAWNALYSPKGKDGLPKAMFDPVTGKIDKEVAKHWKKYDLLAYTSANWQQLGPKLKGKIHIWMGDMDNFYLNNALRDFNEYLKTTENPKSDAEINFTPMKEHCSNYSHELVLKEIQKRLKEIKAE